MRLHTHVCHIRRACCPRRTRCGACRPPRSYYLRHMHVHIVHADVLLFPVNAYNYTSESHSSYIAGPFRSRACFSEARLAPAQRARTSLWVLRCVEARALGRRTCTPTSSRRPGLPLCPRVVCVCAVLRLRTSLASFSSSVLLIERLTMANTCVGPVPCISQQCTHTP